jgi:predicted ferric reductase
VFIAVSKAVIQTLTFKSLIMNSELKLTSVGISYLNQARKWTYFLSIIGFIFTGLIVLMALFFSSFMALFSGMDSSYGVSEFTSMGTGMVTVFYLFFALLYFFLSLYLYRFSKRVKGAINEEGSSQLEDGLKNLNSYWKLTGILTVVGLGVYVLFFLISIQFGAAAFVGA